MQKILGKIRSSYCVIRKIRPYLNNEHLHIQYYIILWYKAISFIEQLTWLHGNRVIANKIQKICDKFQKML